MALKHYLDLAKQYFQQLEGLQLYPSYRSPWFWAWVIATGIWLRALGLLAAQPSGVGDMYLPVLLPELFWVGITLRIGVLKERRLIATTNQRLGTSFSLATECRCHLLSTVMEMQPSEYLKTAKEIDDLLALQKRFRKYSDFSASELARTIYDRDSKARLLALVIALVSMTVALAARSDATLETVFEVYSESGNWDFLVWLAGVSLIVYMASVGLRMLTLAGMDFLALWFSKLSRGSAFSGWLLSYLARDLVRYHRVALEVPEKANAPKSVRLELDVSNIVRLDSSRTS